MDSKDKVTAIPHQPPSQEKIDKFQNELRDLINRHSMENISNTPDFIIADHMVQAMMSFGKIMHRRDKWRDYKAPVTETVND